MNPTFEATTESTETTEMPEPILISGPTSCRERREAAQRERETISTWHNGRFGCWLWSELTETEQRAHMAALQRNQYVQLFGVYA